MSAAAAAPSVPRLIASETLEEAVSKSPCTHVLKALSVGLKTLIALATAVHWLRVNASVEDEASSSRTPNSRRCLCIPSRCTDFVLRDVYR